MIALVHFHLTFATNCQLCLKGAQIYTSVFICDGHSDFNGGWRWIRSGEVRQSVLVFTVISSRVFIVGSAISFVVNKIKQNAWNNNNKIHIKRVPKSILLTFG